MKKSKNSLINDVIGLWIRKIRRKENKKRENIKEKLPQTVNKS